MIRFVLADLRRLWAASLVIVLLVALATALGVAVTLQERALRLGSARAADKFDLIVGAPGSETQLVLSSVFLQPAALPLMPGDVLTKLIANPRVAWAAPIGFGDTDKARKLLKEALAQDPGGLDANYFYGDFLLDQGDKAGARAFLQKALRAPHDGTRPVWDAGRRREVQALLAKAR